MISQSGRVRVRANLSARQAKERGLLTSGTYGLPGFISLKSVALTISLANKLRLRLASSGSTLFELTWKERATPAGQLMYALRALAPRTSDSAIGGWPTPMAGTPAQSGYNEAGNNDSSRKTVALASWPTPVVNDSVGSDYAYNQGRHDSITLKLGGVAKLASWSTPKASDGMGGRTTKTKGGGNSHLDIQARSAASGVLPTGSTAPMKSIGQLNPAHSRWLMGYPPVWDDCGVTAMQSSRKSRRK